MGSHLQSKTFNTIEVRFRNPLKATETVLVEVRNFFNGSVSSGYIYTAPTNSTDLSFTCPALTQNNEEIAIRLVTTPLSDASNGTACPIKQIILR